MGYNSIRIERERGSFTVRATDPAIEAANKARNSKDDCCSPSTEWRDPQVEFKFDTKEQVMKFLDGAIDIALPQDTYTSTFDTLAKEAVK